MLKSVLNEMVRVGDCLGIQVYQGCASLTNVLRLESRMTTPMQASTLKSGCI